MQDTCSTTLDLVNLDLCQDLYNIETVIHQQLYINELLSTNAKYLKNLQMFQVTLEYFNEIGLDGYADCENDLSQILNSILKLMFNGFSSANANLCQTQYETVSSLFDVLCHR